MRLRISSTNLVDSSADCEFIFWVLPYIRISMNGGVNSESDEWNTDQICSSAWEGHNMDGNVNIETNEQGKALDAWESHSKVISTKRDSGGWGTWGTSDGQGGPDGPSHRKRDENELGRKALYQKQHAGDDNVKKDTDAWGKTPEPWKRPRGDGNVDRVTDRWGSALEKTSKDQWKHCSREGNFKRAKGETGGWDKAPDKSDHDQWKQHGRRGDVHRGSKGCGRAPYRSYSDASRKHIGEGNVNKETGEWASWKQHGGRGDVHRGSNEWGKAPGRSDSDASRQHIEEGHVSKETDGWASAAKQDSPDDVWERLSKEPNINREKTTGWGTWGTDGGSGNAKRETDGRGETPTTDPWKQPNRDFNAKKETNGWGKTPNQTSPDSLNHQLSVFDLNRKPAPDKSNRRSRDDHLKVEIDGCKLPPQEANTDPWKCHGNDGRETSGWGLALDQSGRVALNQNWGDRRDGNVNGGANGVKEAALDPWECHVRHGDTKRGADAWRCESGDGNLNRATDVWGSKPLDQMDRDPWKRNNSSTSPKWGQNRSTSWCPPHGSNRRGRIGGRGLAGRGRRGGSHWRDSHEGSGPGHFDGEDRSRLHRVKRSDAVCFSFLKGTCYRGSDCRFAHSDASNGGGRVKDESQDRTCNPNDSSSTNCMGGDGSRAPTRSVEAENSTNDQAKSFKIGGNAPMLDEYEKPKQVEHSSSTVKETGLQTGQSKNGQVPPSAYAGVPAGDESNARKDEKEIRKFKFALADFVKEILKPAWKEGQLSKEVYKVIVKRAVDKVIGVLPGPNIPRTEEQIGQYLSFCEAKLKDLVQEYMHMFLRAEFVIKKG